MKINAVAKSHTGCVRTVNEDSIYIHGESMKMGEGYYTSSLKTNLSDEDSLVFAVCDGMGGEAFGERASYIAIQEVYTLHKKLIATQNQEAQTQTERENTVNDYIKRANARINDEIKKNGKSMGTTVVLLYIYGKNAYFYNLGDSRVYIQRNEQLTQISQDHTVTGRLVRIGAITQEQAQTHPGRNQLTQCLGTPEDELSLEIYKTPPLEIKEGDIYLLCSDGLTEMCNDTEINRILRQNKDIETAANDLIQSAINNGGHDNVSLILISVTD